MEIKDFKAELTALTPATLKTVKRGEDENKTAFKTMDAVEDSF